VLLAADFTHSYENRKANSIFNEIASTAMSKQIQSIDALRGLVMMIMVIDHCCN
jgi:uncharacterized membrane protein